MKCAPPNRFLGDEIEPNLHLIKPRTIRGRVVDTVGGGKHYIRIKAKVRKETKTKTCDRVRLRITVLERADVVYPKDLLSALRAEGVTEDVKSLPPGEQNFILRRIDDAAKPETREKRIQEAVTGAHRRREKLADRAK